MPGQPLAPVIVVGCQKGGIGRTAVATNLAAMLALSGRRTLLVDLDAKGDATVSVGLPRAAAGKTVERLRDPWALLKDTLPVSLPPGLDVWPGGPGLVALRSALSADAPPDLLVEGLSLARQRYRVVVVDAPGDLGPLTSSALAAADVLLVPMSADEAFTERALGDTIAAAVTLRADVRVYGVRLGVRDEDLLTGFEDEAGEEPARGPLGIELLESAICYDAKTFKQAAAAGLPVFEHDPASRAARCFLELGREVIEKVVEPRARAASGAFDRETISASLQDEAPSS